MYNCKIFKLSFYIEFNQNQRPIISSALISSSIQSQSAQKIHSIKMVLAWDSRLGFFMKYFCD